MSDKDIRKLSDEFMRDLCEEDSGRLNPLLKRVQSDETLMLGIRKDYINVYYRGGSLLMLKQSKGDYRAKFDEQYRKGPASEKYSSTLKKLPEAVKTRKDIEIWLKSFKKLKELMDNSAKIKSSREREFQQLVCLVNSRSNVANEGEYFITDIEYADNRGSKKMRIDLLAVQWLANDRSKANRLRPVLIEMKYGDNVLDGSASLKVHLDDISELLKDSERKRTLMQSILCQAQQLAKLGLINVKGSLTNVEFAEDVRPEVIFLLADHNPRSKKLLGLVNQIANESHEHFDLRFFVSSFAGFNMHAINMRTIEEFRELLVLEEKLREPKAK